MKFEIVEPSKWYSEEKPSNENKDNKLENEAEKDKIRREKELIQSIIGFLETDRNKLGEGGTAHVYYPDSNPQLCFKVIRSIDVFARQDQIDAVPNEYQKFASDKYKSKQKNRPWHVSLGVEGDFLDSARGVKADARVPEPYLAVSLQANNEGESYFVSDKVNVLVMERLPGVTVEELIQKKLPLPENFNPKKFIKSLSEFFDKIHEEKGLFHRDVAARNIMIDMKTGLPYVIDFGRSNLGHEDSYRDEHTELIFPQDDETGIANVEKDLTAYIEYRQSIDIK